MPMPASDDACRANLFVYSRHFEPLSFKNGNSKKWAVHLFDDVMIQRFDELQGYLSVSAKRREAYGHETGYAGRSLTVETGTLWAPVVTGISMDTAVDYEAVGCLMSLPHLIAGPDGYVENTYVIAIHLGREKIIRPERKTATYRPELEVYTVSDSEGFCQDVTGILEESLPDGVVAQNPKRLGMERIDGNGFNITYNDGPISGGRIILSKTRFG